MLSFPMADNRLISTTTVDHHQALQNRRYLYGLLALLLWFIGDICLLALSCVLYFSIFVYIFLTQSSTQRVPGFSPAEMGFFTQTVHHPDQLVLRRGLRVLFFFVSCYARYPTLWSVCGQPGADWAPHRLPGCNCSFVFPSTGRIEAPGQLHHASAAERLGMLIYRISTKRVVLLFLGNWGWPLPTIIFALAVLTQTCDGTNCRLTGRSYATLQRKASVLTYYYIYLKILQCLQCNFQMLLTDFLAWILFSFLLFCAFLLYRPAAVGESGWRRWP